MKLPIAAFFDAPPDWYPLRIEFLRADTCTVVQLIDVCEPGVIEVPALARQLGCPIGVRITYATGEIEECWPEPEVQGC